jgi:glycosyltransferase involved in cell wall biosynthesis
MAKIVIWLGAAPQAWNPHEALLKGIGGSETAAIHMSIELTLLGHQVTVYADVPLGTEPWAVVPPGTVDLREVDWLPYSKMPEHEQCDLFISSRQPEARLNLVPDCGQAWLWMHDIHCGPDWDNVLELHYDKILCLSKWARERFLSYYPAVKPEKVVQTRNGINERLFNWSNGIVSCPDNYIYHHRPGDQHLVFKDLKGVLRRHPLRVTYSSSPDRGLARLLDFWPKIFAKYGADSSLHVYYGFETWRRLAELQGLQHQLPEIEWLEYRLATTPGVVFHGRVGQDEVARSYLQSQLWLYPTDFEETSCITAMEAQAAGCRIVATRCGALPETVPQAWFVDGPTRGAGSQATDYEARFLEAVDRAMACDYVYLPSLPCWANVAKQWDEWISKGAGPDELVGSLV